MKPRTRLEWAVLAAVLGPLLASAQLLPEKDLRTGPVKTLNTPRVFPPITTKADWERRAREIREQVLVSSGLWPLPERPPLNAQIFGRLERDGYSVEKVYFQTHAGFYLAGNLYRPHGQGAGPFPAVLNPHGHWAHGRLEDTETASVIGRCINQARQGMIALAYDMVGYNDTHFAVATNATEKSSHGHFGASPTLQLWHINLMGLQTWNSLRALDFLESLPEVDKTRLGCTGASGGGTQTFMLGAIDDRLAVQAPNVMVSHVMQGGCACENEPGLRIEFSNMEIAAAAAPRPQILVAASGDWTKTTATLEGPAVKSVYRLFEAPDKLHYVRLEFDHNYNQTSREQVYGWFGKWLRDLPTSEPLAEKPFHKEPDSDLRVFPDGKLPPDALTEEQLTRNLIAQSRAQLFEPFPKNPPLLERYQQLWLPAWRHTLQAAFVDKGLLVLTQKMTKLPDYNLTDLALGRSGRGDRLSAVLLTPRRDVLRVTVVLAHPRGKTGCLETPTQPTGLARQFLGQGFRVLMVDTFQTGELADPEAQKRDLFGNFFTTYNRTPTQERVQDLITACAYAQTLQPTRPVILCGVGRAGLWALLAAPAADAVVADCDAFNAQNDDSFLAADIFVPGLLKLGGFESVAALAATNPLLLHHTGESFPTARLQQVYKENHVPERYSEEKARLDDKAIGAWVGRWSQGARAPR